MIFSRRSASGVSEAFEGVLEQPKLNNRGTSHLQRIAKAARLRFRNRLV